MKLPAQRKQDWNATLKSHEGRRGLYGLYDLFMFTGLRNILTQTWTLHITIICLIDLSYPFHPCSIHSIRSKINKSRALRSSCLTIPFNVCLSFSAAIFRPVFTQKKKTKGHAIYFRFHIKGMKRRYLLLLFWTQRKRKKWCSLSLLLLP